MEIVDGRSFINFDSLSNLNYISLIENYEEKQVTT